MDFYAVLEQVLDLLRRRGRVSYRALKVQFHLDDDYLAALKDEIVEAQRLASDEDGKVLVWLGDTVPIPPAHEPEPAPLAYTPPHLTEKILTTRSALEGERKQVTVLFADIKGSMELIQGLDPEEARQLLDPALQSMMAAVHRYEGTVNQVLGDGIMALFGAPLAHEDHAARACYAALAMQDAMRRYADEVRRTHGMTVQVRVGLNSGEVVVRAIGNDLHMDYSAVGQTTHLAARMEQLATPGSILLTAATLRLVEGLVRVQALGPVPVKGLAEPVEVFELVGVSAVRRRFQAVVARGLTRFVGRQTELGTIRQALERAGAGHGQVVALLGEAGVGKSRLVYEMVHSHHTQGWRVLESASVSYGKATPYFPVIDLLRRYTLVEERDDTRTIRAKVTGPVLTLDESLHDTLPALLALLEALPEDSPFHALDPPQRRQRTLDGLKRVLLRESQVQPLLLVFEDLHWIDSETQALLDNLVESLPTARLLLLVNYRPEYQHGWGSKTYYSQIRLDPLPPASAEELLQALLGDDSSLASLTRLLIARTAGNPFFLEESVRTLVETGVLVGGLGAYRLAQPLDSLQVPATAQAVLAARIDRLPLEEKRLLQTAAVIGTEVPFPLLQAIAEMPEAALHRSLAHLQSAEFLYETRLFPEREFMFKHALIQEAAYQSLLKSTRQQYHRRIARVLEARFPEICDTQPEVLAQHHTEAGQSAQAVVYWQQAGQRARARSANTEAIIHLTKGLEVLTTLPDTPEHTQHELDLQLALGSALIDTRGYAAPEVAQAFARTRQLCQQVGDSRRLYPVLQGLCMSYTVRGELQTARELGEQLLELAQSLQEPVFLVEAHRTLGETLFWLAHFAPARTYFEQGMALCDPLQHRSHPFFSRFDPRLACLFMPALGLWVLGYPDQALAKSHEGLTLAHELSHPFSLAYALCFAGLLHQCRREGQVAQARAEALLALAHEQGFAYRVARGTILRGWALAAQGQGEEGIVQLHQGLVAYQATGAVGNRPTFLGWLAEAYGQGGQAEAGLHLLAEALALVDSTGERWWEAELYRVKGELLLQSRVQSPESAVLPPDSGPQPLDPEAEECLRQALDVARCQQAKSLELRAAMSLSRLWQRQGKCQEARDLLAPIYNWFTEGFDTADLREAKVLLEELGE